MRGIIFLLEFLLIVHILHVGSSLRKECCRMARLPGRRRRLKPHRRTHTMSFYRCAPGLLLSPNKPYGIRVLKGAIRDILLEAGFNITKDPTTGRYDIHARPFGEGYGYTIMVILSESGVQVHTYPENKYGRLLEVEFNLCYLTVDHARCLRRAQELFREKFHAKQVSRYNSRRRYFRNVTKQPTRKQ